jgi:hypothetical protein
MPPFCHYDDTNLLSCLSAVEDDGDLSRLVNPRNVKRSDEFAETRMR